MKALFNQCTFAQFVSFKHLKAAFKRSNVEIPLSVVGVLFKADVPGYLKLQKWELECAKSSKYRTAQANCSGSEICGNEKCF